MAAALFLGLSLIATPVFADSATDDAERLATEGLGKILGALDLLMKTIPQYAAPEVQPNGDIIIRRLHPEDAPRNKPEEEHDEPSDGTET
nr:hypothetical protein [uncultured Dongia sp.]